MNAILNPENLILQIEHLFDLKCQSDCPDFVDDIIKEVLCGYDQHQAIQIIRKSKERLINYAKQLEKQSYMYNGDYVGHYFDEKKLALYRYHNTKFIKILNFKLYFDNVYNAKTATQRTKHFIFDKRNYNGEKYVLKCSKTTIVHRFLKKELAKLNKTR